MKQPRILGKLIILCTLLAAVLLIGPGLALSTPIVLDEYATDYQGTIYDNWYTQYKFALTGEPFSETLGDWDYTNPAIAFCIDATLGTKGPYTIDSLSGYSNNDDLYEFTSPNYTLPQIELAAKYADYFFTHDGNQSDYQIAIWMALGIKDDANYAVLDGVSDIINGVMFDDAGWEGYELNTALVVAFSENGQNYLRRSAAPVPEPGTIVLMGLGLVGLAGLGRKRFRK